MRFLDLSGQTFGRLTVVSRVENVGKKVAWSCVCVCGKNTISATNGLTSGTSSSCGCKRAESNRKAPDKKQTQQERKKYESSYYRANAEKIKARSKARFAKLSPEQRERERNRTRTWNQKNRDICRTRARAIRIRAKFGISVEEYLERLQGQEFMCAICQKYLTGKCKANLDHCHKSGKIREFLCDGCNLGLGSFADNIGKMRSAISYLQKHA